MLSGHWFSGQWLSGHCSDAIPPHLNVVSGVTINLSSTTRHSQAPAAGPGQHGQPGSPGSQGGSFFALAFSYDRPHLLKVTVNGGPGGNGQNGGVGVDAVNGATRIGVITCGD